MRQVVQNYKTGEMSLLEVPVPACKPGGVLVRTTYSLISPGTELMKVGEAGMSMLAKARARPDQVAKVVQSAAAIGPVATYRKVLNRLDSYTPLGYSLCGVVEEVGEGVIDVAVGDVVACAGNEHALHGEINWVPTNLYCRVPDGVAPEHAAFGTVGAVAMHGVRRGEPQLGDVALVVGLGLIGQLTVQLLSASGVRVIGMDLAAARCELAERLGAQVCGPPGSELLEAAIHELTAGHGVDQVYLAAGGSSNDPVEAAVRLSRDRGRIVDIGKCRLDLPWNACYEKELEVRFSRSYGPGRYDPDYELDGRDYPIGYVRWTERRNVESVLDLIARHRIDVEPLISHVVDFDSALDAYERLSSGELQGVGVLFRYPDGDRRNGVPAERPPGGNPGGSSSNGLAAVPRLHTPSVPRAVLNRPVQIAFIGAGNYASSMLLPHLTSRSDIELGPVVTTSALSATNAKRKFGFTTASTDVDAVLADPGVDAVFVVTRHSSHAELVQKALHAGKAVFVEKPLALTDAELDDVLSAVEESGNDRLQVGFNRRFAPLLRDARSQFGRRAGPASVRYLVNLGRRDQQSWYLRRDKEGTSFVGEGGHFIDTVGWLLGADPSSVFADATPEQADLQVLLSYPDGSSASITYATSGTTRFQKETIDVLADGKVLRIDDFRRISLYGRRRPTPRLRRGQDKGQRAQLEAFIDAVRNGGPMPIPIASLAATTRATLAVQRSIATRAPVRLAADAHDLDPIGGSSA
ncbi:bi-domain-containing oxidoreductase [Pseudonocardia yuanmonensis]|uniref:Bi-domain-containing oxidoreductase n=1 Tax=Pseudonocardia yuanmonensis TaxID=1095914 RepID=A0ABP8VXC9_9PSEU